jgi:hypothetical protein
MPVTASREITLQDLGELSLRATVAFAVRCALRVRPGLNDLPKDFPHREKALATVDAAIAAAADYSRATIKPQAQTAALAAAALQIAETTYSYRKLGAYAAAHAAKAAAEATGAGEWAKDAIAMEVVASAYGANRVALNGGTGSRLHESSGGAIRAAIREDFVNLKKISTGTIRDLGEPIDPSENGPLGPLWPDGAAPSF